MVQLGIFCWLLFFALLAFSMMPGAMTFVVVVSFIGGLIDAIRKNQKQQDEKPNFKLDKFEQNF